MYKIIDKQSVESPEGIRFPIADGNRHYEAYKTWLNQGNIPSTTEGSIYKVVQHEAKPQKWTKEGEADVFEQPMIPERWSDGITTVYSEEETPLQDDGEGNMIPDPDFVYFQATEDDSWTYVAAIPFYWELQLKESAQQESEQSAIESVVRSAMSFGQNLMVEFAAENIKMGITQDGMTKTVRTAMADVMLAIQTGSLYDAIDEIKAIPGESKDAKYITDARLLKYLNKVEEYLGVSLSQSL